MVHGNSPVGGGDSFTIAGWCDYFPITISWNLIVVAVRLSLSVNTFVFIFSLIELHFRLFRQHGFQ